ncbi:MAG: DUF262 domain-containing protein [Myxococcota bacterium]|jgi:hypothetical protein
MSHWNSSPHPLSDVRDWNATGRLELRPDFQRKEVWTLPAKIMLIDSILRGVPLPKVYLANEIRNDSTFRVVIDGQQRISAILEFLRDGFALAAPYDGDELGKRFSDFDVPVRDAFLRYKIDFAEASNADDREIRDVYMRVNKYTVPLNKQELRRADFPGDFLDMAEALSVDDALEEAGIFTATDRKRYADAEFVSEVLAALIDGPQDKKTSLDDFYMNYATWVEGARSGVRRRFDEAVADMQTIFSHRPNGMRSTRFKQKADFYTLILAVDELRAAGGTIEGKDLTALQADLDLIDAGIAPASDVPIFSEYAIKCVSQANSLSSRRWRTDFLRPILSGTYLSALPATVADVETVYRLRQEAGTDGQYHPDPVVHCPVCNVDLAGGTTDCVIGWPPETTTFQISNSDWCHTACLPDGWIFLARSAQPAVDGGAA